MADSNLDEFVFSKGVFEILEKGPENWIDVIPWDVSSKGWEEEVDNWIDVIPWDFKVNDDGQVFFKDVAVAKVQTTESDGEWLAGLLSSLGDEGFF